MRDNNDLFQELRVWTLENLETLNLKKISFKINKLLQSPIKNDSSFSLAYDITYPVKESSIRRWMDDLGFVYCPVKKIYMMNIHEREDARVDRKKYITENFKHELEEPCFSQFSKKGVTNLLNKSKIAPIQQRETMQKAFTKDDVLEFHFDGLDAFTEMVKDWPLKGATSVRQNPTAKISIVFGQDDSM